MRIGLNWRQAGTGFVNGRVISISFRLLQIVKAPIYVSLYSLYFRALVQVIFRRLDKNSEIAVFCLSVIAFDTRIMASLRRQFLPHKKNDSEHGFKHTSHTGNYVYRTL
jgi:hypothetical protein